MTSEAPPTPSCDPGAPPLPVPAPAGALRVACLWVPQAGLAALLRAHPELHGLPVALVNAPGAPEQLELLSRPDPGLELAAGLGQLRVLAFTPEAEGLRVGMTVAQARACVPGLLVRRRSVALERAAAAALREVALRHSPAVEVGEHGELYLDVRGLSRLFPSESALGLALCTQASRVGLPARVGVASSKGVARIVSCTGHVLDRDGEDGREERELCDAGGPGEEAITVVPVGQERAVLAPLPVSALRPSRALAETLARWGIRTAGELAALPLEGVALRLGREGEGLWLLARGEPGPADPADPRGETGGRLLPPLSPEPLPEVYEEGLDLEWACETLEPLTFLLRGVVGRLLDRLEGRGLACRALDLRLGLERSRDLHGELRGPQVLQRVVPLAIPTRDAETLLAHARLVLGREPLPAAVVSLGVVARVAPLEGEQLGLLGPSAGGQAAGPDPEALARVVARLSVIAGEGQVGIPVLVDSHRPDAFALAPVTLRSEPEPQVEPEPDPQPPECQLTFRHVRPPLEIRVRARGTGQPLEVRAPADAEELPAAARVRQAAGPFRTGGEWWSSQPFGRDDWDVLLETGHLVRIYRDHDDNRWYLGGLYD